MCPAVFLWSPAVSCGFQAYRSRLALYFEVAVVFTVGLYPLCCWHWGDVGGCLDCWHGGAGWCDNV